MEPTEHLRWVSYWKQPAPNNAIRINDDECLLLQQWWQSDKMIVDGEWRVIPIVGADHATRTDPPTKTD